MANELRILISGDLFMKPEVFQDVLERRLAGEGYDLEFRTIEYPYPIEEFTLADYTLPTRTGGVWDEAIEHPEREIHGAEVSEYYGEIDGFVGKITDEDILIVHMSPITRAVLAQAKNLRLIACCRGGPKNINVVTATERAIPVVNTPGRNSTAVAEFTVGLLLAHTRYIARGHAHLWKGIWKVGAYRDRHLGPELCGRAVGIVGLGNIGQEIAKMLSGFRVRLCAYDPYVGDEIFQALAVERVSLDGLLRKSDFVILAARLTPSTTRMIGARELALMKPGAYLVNTARGGLLDYDALRCALRENRIAGAALDVFGEEPPLRDDPLLQMPNVTFTPHIGGASVDVLHNAAETIGGEVLRFLRGEPLHHCLNPEALARMEPIRGRTGYAE
jgi:D-3-phosphoglycerate dehydrogenase